jgi:hypothetical protein
MEKFMNNHPLALIGLLATMVLSVDILVFIFAVVYYLSR